MSHRLIIAFSSPTLDEIHRIRNFGEDLFRTFKANNWAQISLDAIDRAEDQLLVIVRHRKQVRRVKSLIEHMLAEQHLDRIGTVSAPR